MTKTPKHIEELPDFIAKVLGSKDQPAEESDLTNLAVGVTTLGFVHVAFGASVEWIALTPEHAEAVAALLTHYAAEARKMHSG